MHHEVFVPAPLRIDLDQLRADVDHSHARRHHGSDADRKVDAVHPRHVAAGENGLLNPRALLRSEVAAAGRAGRAATGLTRGLTLLWRLTLLRRRLALLARSLTGGVISLLVLAALLGLALLALITFARPALALLCGLTGLGLAFLALLHLVLSSRALACGLLTLAFTPAGLRRRTPLAFALALLRLGFMLTLLRLSRGGLALRLPVLLRWTLLALLLGATLRLAGALLVARSGGAAFHLRAALGCAAG